MIELLAIATILAGAEPARPVGLSSRTIERLAECAEAERTGPPEAALTQYLKLLDDARDDWVPAQGSAVLHPCERVILGRIAGTSAMQAAYRHRFEDQASRMLRDASATRDLLKLRNLTREWYPTRAAARALDLLGDLECEVGNAAEARVAWQRIVGPMPGDPPALPDHSLDPASIHAKIIVAGRLLGEDTSKVREEFAKRFPKNRGRLAGREGLLIDILVSLEQDASLPLRPTATNVASTFAVDEQRRGVLRRRIAHLAPRAVEKPFPWPGEELDDVPTVAWRSPRTYPFVWQNRIAVAARGRIAAIDPDAGRIVDIEADDRPRDDTEITTFSSDGDRLFARLHREAVVALVGEVNEGGFRWKRLWLIRSKQLGAGVQFEGCPLVVGHRVYLSWTVNDAGRSVLHIGCFDAANPETGPRWSRAVAELPPEPAGSRRPILLTRAGTNVVACTDAGIIVSLDATTGRPAWLYRYSTRGNRGLTGDLMPSPRDVCPPVAADGRVFVAPADCEELLALDADSGMPLWKQPPVLETVHVLGVVGGRLIVTADGPLRGIGAINVVSGKIDPNWGSFRSAPPGGRGMILDDVVLFPTRTNGLQALTLQGQPIYTPAAFRKLPPGNLALAGETLVIAGPDRMTFVRFGPPRFGVLREGGTAPSTGPARIPGLTHLRPAWTVELPRDERPLRATHDRLFTARDTSLIVRRLPGADLEARHELGFTPVAMVGTRVLGHHRVAELTDRGMVEVRPDASPSDSRYWAEGVASEPRESGPARWTADAGAGRVVVGSMTADWVWTDARPATHQYVLTLLTPGNGQVIDRVTIPAFGPGVAVGGDAATLVIAVTGSVRGFEAP
ncbi:MAG: PQQ-like beta-propeller repeat protein [Gemmataceae bacterium]|nr:PQQ-like beta-propeller repeat protein [Gemmataceae bacterium]